MCYKQAAPIIGGYIISAAWTMQKIQVMTINPCLVDLFQLLDNHRAGSTAAVADGSNTVFAGLQLVQESD